MPLDPGQQCSYCGFNRRNRGEWTSQNHGEPSFCTIRGVAIPVCGHTYCDNVTTRKPKPTGPIYSMGLWQPYYGGRVLPWWDLQHGETVPPWRFPQDERHHCLVCGAPFRGGLHVAFGGRAHAFCGNTCYLIAWKAAHPAQSSPASHQRSYSAHEADDEGNPTAPDDWHAMADALERRGKQDYATAALELAAEEKPGQAAAYFLKAASVAAKDPERARGLVDHGLALDPASVAGWALKGAFLVEDEQYDAGIKACDRALQLDATNATAWYGKATALLYFARDLEVEETIADLVEAQQCFDAAVHFASDDPRCWFGRGEALELGGHVGEARYAFFRAACCGGGDAAVQAEARCATRLEKEVTDRRTEEEKKQISLAERLYRDAVAAYEAHDGNAFTLSDQAVGLNPIEGRYWRLRGEIYERARNHEAAVMQFVAALIADQSDEVARAAYRRNLAAAGWPPDSATAATGN